MPLATGIIDVPAARLHILVPSRVNTSARTPSGRETIIEPLAVVTRASLIAAASIAETILNVAVYPLSIHIIDETFTGYGKMGFSQSWCHI